MSGDLSAVIRKTMTATITAITTVIVIGNHRNKIKNTNMKIAENFAIIFQVVYMQRDVNALNH